MLRVYGWEPTRCFDTLATAWGRVADIAIAQSQLVSNCNSTLPHTIWYCSLPLHIRFVHEHPLPNLDDLDDLWLRCHLLLWLPWGNCHSSHSLLSMPFYFVPLSSIVTLVIREMKVLITWEGVTWSLPDISQCSCSLFHLFFLLFRLVLRSLPDQRQYICCRYTGLSPASFQMFAATQHLVVVTNYIPPHCTATQTWS